MSQIPPPPPPPGMPPPPGWRQGNSAQGWQQPAGPKPPNYLVWAILTTVFCCLPFGVVSIVFAAQVDGKYNSGDFAGAAESSRTAKKWAIVAAVSSLVVLALYFVFVIAVVAGSRA